MRRRRSEDVDSLELLLDTVTNAFGGIMFLAILLSMMLKLSTKVESIAPAPDPARSAEMKRNAERLQELSAELATLQSAAALQADSIEKLADPTTAQRYEQLKKLRELRSQQETEIAKEVAAAAKAQAELDEVRREFAEQESKNSEVAESISARKKELRDQMFRSARSVVPPHSQATNKREAPTIIVRYGRVYVKHELSADGLTRAPNLRDFAVVEEARDSITLSPIPTRGLKVAKGDEFKSALQALLYNHPPQNWYVCVAIWEDSFASYQPLKESLMDLGYKIRLIPANKGEELSESSRVNAQVQ